MVLVVTLGATGTLVAAGAADRTAKTYPEYLERARVGDVVINPSLLTTDIRPGHPGPARGAVGGHGLPRSIVGGDAHNVGYLADATPQAEALAPRGRTRYAS